MINESFEFAAKQLADARLGRTQIDRLPEQCRPRTAEDAIQIQRRAFELTGEACGGWKCSVPVGDRMIVAPLPASTIYHSSPVRILPKGAVAQIEPEIAFLLKRDLPPTGPTYTADEVLDAIAETRLVLELMGSRYADHDSVTFLEALADSVRHQAMFIGPLIPGGPGRTLEWFHLRIESPSGVVFDRDVTHPNDHPLRPLQWLANYLSPRGETLSAGGIITTGSYAGIIEVPMNTPLTLTYGDLGSFDVQLEPL